MTRICSFPICSGRPKCRAGYSLSELAIVLAIVGFITGAIWSYAGSTWQSYLVETVVGQVSKSVDNIRDHFNAVQNWPAAGISSGTDVTKTFDGYNLFPLEMRANQALPGATNINHALNATVAGGSFHVLTETNPFGGGLVNTFRVELQGLTQSACIRLLMAEPLNDAAVGIVQVKVTGIAANSCTIQNGAQSASCTSNVTPMLITQAKAWCNGAGNVNEIDLDFKLHN